MKIERLFLMLGLAQEQALLYQALLKQGPLTLAELARKARMHRPAAYRLLPELEEQGIVKRILRGKRTYFAAESPEKLEFLLEDARHDSVLLLHELKERFEKSAKVSQITVGHGRKEIANVYEDILLTLKHGDTFYRYSSASKSRPKNAYVPKDYEARRDAKRLERYVITNKRSSALKVQKLERYIRIIPPDFDKFEYDITLLVYANKVAYVDYASESAVVIENPAVAEFQKKLFKLQFSKL